MQFLKILFWCLLAFLAAVFTVGNWTRIEIRLWNDIVALVNLPLLLLVTFLAGLVPTLIYQHAVRWRLKQRLQAAEQRAAFMAPPLPSSPPPTPTTMEALPAAPVAPPPEAV
jgi:hypothetical protein